MSTQSPSTLSPHVDWLNIVRSKADGIRFGTIQVVIHDGRITQIESTEKTRLEDKSATTFVRKRDSSGG